MTAAAITDSFVGLIRSHLLDEALDALTTMNNMERSALVVRLCATLASGAQDVHDISSTIRSCLQCHRPVHQRLQKAVADLFLAEPPRMEGISGYLAFASLLAVRLPAIALRLMQRLLVPDVIAALDARSRDAASSLVSDLLNLVASNCAAADVDIAPLSSERAEDPSLTMCSEVAAVLLDGSVLVTPRSPETLLSWFSFVSDCLERLDFATVLPEPIVFFDRCRQWFSDAAETVARCENAAGSSHSERLASLPSLASSSLKTAATFPAAGHEMTAFSESCVLVLIRFLSSLAVQASSWLSRSAAAHHQHVGRLLYEVLVLPLVQSVVSASPSAFLVVSSFLQANSVVCHAMLSHCERKIDRDGLVAGSAMVLLLAYENVLIRARVGAIAIKQKKCAVSAFDSMWQVLQELFLRNPATAPSEFFETFLLTAFSAYLQQPRWRHALGRNDVDSQVQVDADADCLLSVLGDCLRTLAYHRPTFSFSLATELVSGVLLTARPIKVLALVFECLLIDFAVSPQSQSLLERWCELSEILISRTNGQGAGLVHATASFLSNAMTHHQSLSSRLSIFMRKRLLSGDREMRPATKNLVLSLALHFFPMHEEVALQWWRALFPYQEASAASSTEPSLSCTLSDAAAVARFVMTVDSAGLPSVYRRLVERGGCDPINDVLVGALQSFRDRNFHRHIEVRKHISVVWIVDLPLFLSVAGLLNLPIVPSVFAASLSWLSCPPPDITPAEALVWAICFLFTMNVEEVIRAAPSACPKAVDRLLEVLSNLKLTSGASRLAGLFSSVGSSLPSSSEPVSLCPQCWSRPQLAPLDSCDGIPAIEHLSGSMVLLAVSLIRVSGSGADPAFAPVTAWTFLKAERWARDAALGPAHGQTSDDLLVLLECCFRNLVAQKPWKTPVDHCQLLRLPLAKCVDVFTPSTALLHFFSAVLADHCGRELSVGSAVACLRLMFECSRFLPGPEDAVARDTRAAIWHSVLAAVQKARIEQFSVLQQVGFLSVALKMSLRETLSFMDEVLFVRCPTAASGPMLGRLVEGIMRCFCRLSWNRRRWSAEAVADFRFLSNLAQSWRQVDGVAPAVRSALCATLCRCFVRMLSRLYSSKSKLSVEDAVVVREAVESVLSLGCEDSAAAAALAAFCARHGMELPLSSGIPADGAQSASRHVGGAVVRGGRKIRVSFKSRNPWVNAHLRAEDGRDTYADLEDFIVCKRGKRYDREESLSEEEEEEKEEANGDDDDDRESAESTAE